MANGGLVRGVISAAQGKSLGFSYMGLSRSVKSGELERVARGVYGAVDAPDDLLFIEQLRRPKIVYSHGTALYLHGLSDRDPVKFSVTVPFGYNTKGLLRDGFKVFSVKADSYGLDVVRVATKYGYLVNTYSAERAVCDVVRSRSRIDSEIVVTAVKRYVTLKDRDIPQLLRVAERFRVAKPIKTYLEVLL
ncbi:MAG: abortive phage infection protein [Propionibacteriaceae bacterium]|jgi:predicted transcriptional regulator of viral defense system|nr:abortive phage infection protein [Propionibacteriaceae bacterium]